MIARLTGRLVRKRPHEVILDVNGVGYRILIPLFTFYALPDEGAEAALETYTAVREDAINLFGFHRRREKKLFEQLITVSKVGPKLALNILSGMAAEELCRAISAGDVERLTTVPGLGPKTAGRLVVELRDKVVTGEPAEGAELPGPEDFPAGESTAAEDAVQALIGLGYRKKEAEKAVKKSVRQGAADLENIIRAALSLLSS